MATMAMKAQFEASADAVWALVRDFGRPDKFVAAVESARLEGSGVGARRILALGDAEVIERLDAFDDAGRSLTYSIVSAPLPMEGYSSTMKVRPLGRARCELEWSCRFTPKGAPEADVKKIVEGVYTAGFEGIRKLVS
ncbi:MAG TPA: SRPBCC family protein [Planctomycetota bacterium]|nr:SRPBCC family protein [Planctomycetota bacterium]HRR78947.1 SRPBCC family protein [Planctomycetota bacterium]HRT92775.1 SRPBCC family protein [Planctomycetota bacterium]